LIDRARARVRDSRKKIYTYVADGAYRFFLELRPWDESGAKPDEDGAFEACLSLNRLR